MKTISVGTNSVEMIIIIWKVLPWYAKIPVLLLAAPFLLTGMVVSMVGLTLEKLGEVYDRIGWGIMSWALPVLSARDYAEKNLPGEELKDE